MLTARCLQQLGRRSACSELLEELRDERPAREWQSLGCEIGDLHAQTQVGSGTERAALDAVEALLDSASQAGLALRWADLMCTRAELFAASGARADAQTAVRHALLGRCDDEACARRWPQAHLFPSPSEEGYRTAFLRMMPLASAGMDQTAALLDEVLRRTLPPDVPTRSKYCGRRMPRRLEGDARRKQLHEQALEAVREFKERRKPFILYLRKFDVTVLHKAALLGPALLEVGLYDILPESWNMLTIQDSTEAAAYTGSGHAFDRTVPALELGNDQWEEVARWLIANARAIVSECLMLSHGVRKELEIIDELGRNGRTLLVLPTGPLARIDDDPLIQRFPNFVPAGGMDAVELSEIPFLARLLDEAAADAARGE
jgi:hypothetical protein